MMRILITICSLTFVFALQGQVPSDYILFYNSYLGASDWEQTRNIAVDQEGNMYVTGGTSSPDFPTTPGVYQEQYDDGGSSTVGNWGPMAVFVTKFSPQGEMQWSTFIGGPSYDRAYAIEVDEDGLIYIGGRAGEGYPTTSAAYQESLSQGGGINGLYGHQNGFISILSPDGKKLLYSTLYGTDSHGFFRDIDIDDQGNVYGILNAVQRKPSGIRPDAFDTDHNGGQFDMVAVKFSSKLDSVHWATFLGGSGKDRGGPSIRVGSDYSVFVAGGTESLDFPVTSNAVQTQFGGGRTDMFVARINPDATDLIYCTYFGGNDVDVSETHSLYVDQLNQAHIACGTRSTDIQTTPGALKPTKPGDDIDALLFKLSSDGNQLLACSYYGGSGNDYAEGLFTNNFGELFIGGTMGSTDLPVTSNAIQSQSGGGEDAFIAQIDPSFSTLLYSTYLGGAEDDAIRAFAAGPGGSIYFGGQSISNDLPTTIGAYQEKRLAENDRADCFVGILFQHQTTKAAHFSAPVYQLLTTPNPSDGHLQFKSSHSGTLRIVNLKGQVFREIQIGEGNFIPQELYIDRSGVYVLQLIVETGQIVAVEKVIVL